MSNDSDREARDRVIDAAVRYIGQAISTHGDQGQWRNEFDRTLDAYVLAVTGKQPTRRPYRAGHPNGPRIQRAAMLYVLTHYYQNAWQHLGPPLPDPLAVEQELEAALAAHVELETPGSE
ncbi:MAG TPA: hypothetical protein VGJ44_10420 [Kribbellaceae bacterium]|jgi:hypothetical protein